MAKTAAAKPPCSCLANGLLPAPTRPASLARRTDCLSAPGTAQLRQRGGLVFQNPEHQLVAHQRGRRPLLRGWSTWAWTTTKIFSGGLKQAIVPLPISTALVDRPVHGAQAWARKKATLAGRRCGCWNLELLLLDEPTAYLQPRHCASYCFSFHAHAGRNSDRWCPAMTLIFLMALGPQLLFVMDRRANSCLEGPPAEVFAQRQHLRSAEPGRFHPA